MYIDPEACIDCAACVPECPVNAIYEAAAVPAKWDAFTDKNSEFFRQRRFSK
jgi:ferredoxin